MRKNRFALFRRNLAATALATTFALTLTVYAQTSGPYLSLVGAASLTGARVSSDLPQEQGISVDRKFGFGFGAILDAPMGEIFALSVGALYDARKFKINGGAGSVERTVPTIFVPVELKLWFGRILAVGAGAFGALRVGDATDEVQVGGVGLTSSTATDRRTLEYGLVASAEVIFPLAAETGLRIGALYFYGLTNAFDNPVYEEKINDLALIAGITLGF